MIKVLFFARLRETLGVADLQLETSPQLHTIADLIQLLSERDTSFAEALASPQIVCACNHEVVQRHAPINDGDEIAFYPPVTGG